MCLSPEEPTMATRTYTRTDLTRTAEIGPHEWECALCEGVGFHLNHLDINHAPLCPLADPAVSAVTVTPVSAAARIIAGWAQWKQDIMRRW